MIFSLARSSIINFQTQILPPAKPLPAGGSTCFLELRRIVLGDDAVDGHMLGHAGDINQTHEIEVGSRKQHINY